MFENFFKKEQKESFPLNPKQENQNTLIVGLAQSNKYEALFQEIKEKVNYHLVNNKEFDLVFIDFLRVDSCFYVKLYSKFLGDKVKNITSEEDLKTYLDVIKDKTQILVFSTDLMPFEDKQFENDFISTISTNDYDLLAISSKLGVEKSFENLESLFSRKIILSFFEKKISAWKFIKTNESIYINALRTPGYGIEVVNNLMLADFYKIDFITYKEKENEVEKTFQKN